NHVCPITTSKLMEPFLATNFDGPQHDDVRAIHDLYGDAYESNNTSGTATALGALSAGGTINPSTVPAPAITNGALTAISQNGDVDFYSFTTAGSLTISVTVTPLGSTYDSSPQNANGSCSSGNNVNSLTVANLAVEVLASNGTTVLGSASATAAGSAETISNLALAGAGTYYIRVFEVDAPVEAQIYTVSLSASAGCTGPSVSSQPASLSRCSGSSAAFSVTAAGSGPFNYQWRKGVSNIAGATSSTYSIPSVVVGDAGNYTCFITNACGNVTSNIATLSVTESINITGNPSNLTRCVGTSASFSVVATGTSPSFQWQLDGSDIVGANLATLNINPVSLADQGEYTCIVGNACGNLTSGPAFLTVNVAPSFNTSPASQAICVGSPVTFTASATGSPAPTLQWRKNGVDIGGATGTSYTIPSVNAGSFGTYDCVATNSCTSVTSSGAVLTVNDVPQISLQPSPQAVCEGEPFSFSVAATTTVTYQWRKNTVNIGGATSPILNGTATLGDVGSYDCVLTNSCGSTTSNAVAMTVNSGPAITTQPVGSTVNSGAPASLNVVATGTAPVSYQWRRNLVNLTNTVPYSGADSSTLNISAVTNAEAGSFDVVVTDDCGSLTSTAVVIDITTGCPADLDNGTGTGTPDGGIDINDLLFFLNKFEAGAIEADLDNGSGLGVPDGGIDINDLLFFLSHFEAGC
nr:immunoglobulin domain-containing protein [Planctomycetota bacterium]